MERNVLNFEQKMQMAAWLQENDAGLAKESPTYDVVGSRMAKDLGFAVTGVNVMGLIKKLPDLKIGKGTFGSLLPRIGE